MECRIELTIECATENRKNDLLQILQQEAGLSILKYQDTPVKQLYSPACETSDFDTLFDTLKVLLPDITYIKSEKNYCLVHTTNRGEHLLRIPLKKIANHFNSKKLLRIHRSFCVQTNHLRGIYRQNQNWMVVCGDAHLPLSKTFRQLVLTQFAHLMD